ncbi:hypothetical protein RGUI_3097 [Rhodovulum sp. P5]|uniref:hypothetical protein n=1 Tax=Rhodovulum sp. P5 TaxID=1564506 RepID=UPI0009C1FAC0|nr:hypothetical protein [Rhodovulum sp. P5]ARE41238.1 hypothetical protein RGUI_3097 [Rhodovulum sp. P5]
MRRPTDIALLNRLARENRQMGQRLAQLELRDLLSDLDNPSLFELRIDFGAERPPAQPFWPVTHATPLARRLAELDVPLGKIAWAEDPRALPVIGIHVPGTPEGWRDPLRDLMKQHHLKPFARFIFLCASLRPVPFFGRYGFAYDHVGDLAVATIADRLSCRFGIRQIRDIVTGEKVWSAAEPAEMTDSFHNLADN